MSHDRRDNEQGHACRDFGSGSENKHLVPHGYARSWIATLFAICIERTRRDVGQPASWARVALAEVGAHGARHTPCGSTTGDGLSPTCVVPSIWQALGAARPPGQAILAVPKSTTDTRCPRSTGEKGRSNDYPIQIVRGVRRCRFRRSYLGCEPCAGSGSTEAEHPVHHG